MSYSRWSNSNWYSFYQDNTNNLIKENQVLCLWHYSWSRDLTFKEVQNITESDLKLLYPTDISDTDISEAMIIIETFKQDVEREFIMDDLK